MTKIIQLSDPHIVPEGQLAYGRVDTTAPLIECVATINRMLPDIDPVGMVVVTGDLAEFGTIEEYRRFQEIMEPLGLPYRAVPGNHDIRETMRECFSDQSWMPKTGPINWIEEFSDLALIGLDTSVHGEPYGHLSDETLAFLEDSLTSLKTKPALVAIHHPPNVNWQRDYGPKQSS